MNEKEVKYSEKSGLVTFLLCIFLGIIGIHRFYTKKIGTGILMLLLCWTGISEIWWIIDIIMILLGKFKDKSGGIVSFSKGTTIGGLAVETDMEQWFNEKNQKYIFKLVGIVPMGIGSRKDLFVTEKEVIIRHTPYALTVPFEIIRNFKISGVTGITVTENTTTKDICVLTITIPGCAEMESRYQDPELKTDRRMIFFNKSDLGTANEIKKYIDDFK